jgi:holo-[acyl-carrier protein] synthase
MKNTAQFVEKLFTEREREYCDRFTQSAPHYTARFCAKEALRKAMNQPLDWLDMEVVNEPSGKPTMRLYRAAQKAAAERVIFVTLSHAGDYAMATVLVWGGEGRA